MLKRFCIYAVLIACTVTFSATSRCSADLLFSRPSGTAPSIFYYGWRGLFIGSMAGLSAGYVRYADENNTDEMLKSLAYGALTGAGLGLIAGFADASSGNVYGTGDIILRDTNAGGGFGLIVGLIWGGISAISTGNSRDVGKGAAWGYLGGLVVGLGVAIVESANPSAATTSVSLETVKPSIVFFQDSRGRAFPGVRLARRY